MLEEKGRKIAYRVPVSVKIAPLSVPERMRRAGDSWYWDAPSMVEVGMLPSAKREDVDGVRSFPQDLEIQSRVV